MKNENYKKPNAFTYSLLRFASWFMNRLKFHTVVETNEAKGVKGPFLLLVNHEMSLDIACVVNSIKPRMTPVISKSFRNTLPIKGFINSLGAIPKQQFMTNPSDIKKMFSVVDNNGVLVLFPAGLMTEDGIGTTIPESTYHFIKKFKCDIYTCRIDGSYFLNPKWSSGLKKGKCYVNIKKAFTKDELKTVSIEEIRDKVYNELYFDAYDDQEKRMIKYKGIDNLSGIENVLYQCPCCKKEFTMETNNNEIYCTSCGFKEYSDEYGFFHNDNKDQVEIRHASKWSKFILDELKNNTVVDNELKMEDETDIYMINYDKKKYEKVGEGKVSLYLDKIVLKGTAKGEDLDYTLPLLNIPTLPFKPGKNFEVQNNIESYRLVLKNNKNVMKYINYIKLSYSLQKGEN